MALFVVDVVQMNRIIRCRARTEDYDRADEVYQTCKRERAPAREVRMSKYDNGKKILLKYLTKARRSSKREK